MMESTEFGASLPFGVVEIYQEQQSHLESYAFNSDGNPMFLELRKRADCTSPDLACHDTID